MPQITRPCPNCFRTIPSEWTNCPWCGNLFFKAKKKHDRRRALGNITWTLFVLTVAFSVIGIAYNRRFLYPEKMISVKDGTYKHCPLTGADYDFDVVTVRVPRESAGLYGVRAVQACPPDIFNDDKKHKVQDLQNIIVDKTRLRNDEKVKSIRKIYPEMKPEAAWFVGRGRLALGMTIEQVTAVWGKPIGREVFTDNGLQKERLAFGDPVYGLNISCRFADFVDGQLIDFKVNKTIEEFGRLDKDGR